MTDHYHSHACFLLEFSTPESAVRGPRVLFDPVFSHRCSPSQYFGPARFTSEFMFRCSLDNTLALTHANICRAPMRSWVNTRAGHRRDLAQPL
jgi:hypothetical protein